MTALEVVPSGPAHGRITAPASKSVTNRLLVTATLAGGVSMLRDPLVSDDSSVMLDAVAAFGAEVDARPGTWRITGTGGQVRTPDGPVDAGLSGTTMRFLSGVAVLAPKGATVTGSAPLLRRPIGPLVAALSQLGARVGASDGHPPVVAAGGGLEGGQVTVDATASSQFASAVLLVAPYARRDVVVDVRGAGAGGYVELTAAVLRTWGARVEQEAPARWRVAAGQWYAARDVTVEYDASAAAHLLAVAAATGGSVTVTNAVATHQPDAAFPHVLAAMGCDVRHDGDAVTVAGPVTLEPARVDLSAMPDQVTTVAALASMARGTSVITGVAVTRGHETDRLAALAGELGKLGVAVEERPDGLVVHGGGATGPARLGTHGDHRLAMAFAAVGARVPGVVIEDPGCVAKTYPNFWSDLSALGVGWRMR